MQIEALKELAAKVEAGSTSWSGYSVRAAFGGHFQSLFYESFHGSLDAAKALHDAVLPGWTLNGLWEKRNPDKGQHPTGKWVCLLFGIVDDRYHSQEVTAKCPARAWLLAVLKALISQEESK